MAAPDKPTLDWLKLYLSSLTARRMRYYYLDKMNPTWICTSVDPGRITNYYPFSYDIFQFATFQPGQLDLFYQRFPEFKDKCFCLDTKSFMTPINKCTLSNVRLKSISNSVLGMEADYPIAATELDSATTETKNVPIAKIVSPLEVDSLYGLRRESEYGEMLVDTVLTPEQLEKGYKVSFILIGAEQYLPGMIDKYPMLGVYRLPFIDGYCCVSFKEYIKKCKSPTTVRLQMYVVNQFVRHQFLVENAEIKIHVVTPGQAWFNPVNKEA